MEDMGDTALGLATSFSPPALDPARVRRLVHAAQARFAVERTVQPARGRRGDRVQQSLLRGRQLPPHLVEREGAPQDVAHRVVGLLLLGRHAPGGVVASGDARHLMIGTRTLSAILENLAWAHAAGHSGT